MKPEVFGSLFDNLLARQREMKLAPALEALRRGAIVLDVGVWTRLPDPHASENWLEKQYVAHRRIIAVGLEDMTDFQAKYPDILCVQADGVALPFCDGAVDVAIANAVLEHVAQDQQEAFIGEMARVVQDWALLTVPDRWCPVEVHSFVPLLHWLPFWRAAFKAVGKGDWASPAIFRLHLFSRRSLQQLLDRKCGRGQWGTTRQTLLGLPVSLVAVYRKPQTIALSGNDDNK